MKERNPRAVLVEAASAHQEMRLEHVSLDDVRSNAIHYFLQVTNDLPIESETLRNAMYRDVVLQRLLHEFIRTWLRRRSSFLHALKKEKSRLDDGPFFQISYNSTKLQKILGRPAYRAAFHDRKQTDAESRLSLHVRLIRNSRVLATLFCRANVKKRR